MTLYTHRQTKAFLEREPDECPSCRQSGLIPARSAANKALEKSRHEKEFDATCDGYEHSAGPAAGIVLVGGSERSRTRRQWMNDTTEVDTSPLWFRIGSLTKTVVAFAALHHALSQDQDPDGDISSDFRAILGGDLGNQLTLMSLLSHTAGFQNCTALENPTREMAIAQGLRRDRLRGAFAYSNVGYALVGQWLQHKTGLSFDGWLSRHALTPLGISGVAVVPAQSAMRAQGHAMDPHSNETVPISFDFCDQRFAPAGYLWSTLEGLDKFMRGLLQPSDPLTFDVVNLMKTPVSPPFGPSGISSCPGLFLVSGQKGTIHFNEGEIAGFRSRLELDFEAATGLATVSAYSGPEDAARPGVFSPRRTSSTHRKVARTPDLHLKQGDPTFLAAELGIFQCADLETMRNARLNGVSAHLEQVDETAWAGHTENGRFLTLSSKRLHGLESLRVNGHLAFAAQLRWREPVFDPRWFGEYRNGYWIEVSPSDRHKGAVRVASTYDGVLSDALVLGPNMLASDMGLIVFGATPRCEVLRLLGTARFQRVSPAD
jgi:CubicO group peptidase (beta-lactamase class C family)